MTQIRILLVDDQPSVRRGLKMRLQLESDMSVIGEAGDGAEAIAATRALDPDVMVLDYEMPGMNGIETMSALSDAGRRPSIVILSIHDNDALKQAAARAGAHAFVAKHESGDRLLTAIRAAASAREQEDAT